jgi:hypothetical protein
LRVAIFRAAATWFVSLEKCNAQARFDFAALGLAIFAF